MIGDLVHIGSSRHKLSVVMILLSGASYLASMGLGLIQDVLSNLFTIGLINLMILNFYAFMGMAHHLILSDVFPRKFYAGVLSTALVVYLLYSIFNTPPLVRAITGSAFCLIILLPHFILLIREREKLGAPLLAFLAVPFCLIFTGLVNYLLYVIHLSGVYSRYWDTANAKATQLFLFVSFFVFHTGSYLIISRLRTKESERALVAAHGQKNLGMTIVSLIGHDLQSPLSAIKTSASTLDGYSDSGSDSAPAFIGKTVDKIRNLLDNLVYWGRGYQGELKLSPSTVDLRDAVRLAWEVQDLQAGHKGISLSASIPRGTFVTADPQALKAVLRNFFSNAVKFSRPGSEVSAEAEGSGDWVEIRIIDHGTGMRSEELELLRSGALNESVMGTNRERGKGIGMQMVHFICREAGWGLSFESEEGVGTTAFLRLPVA